MASGALLDTSFLITLADRNRPHHEAAKRYWKHFLENQVPIYLSTIVLSEFSVKQALPPEIMRVCIQTPFNHEHALKSATLYAVRSQGQSGQRDSIKDDFKLIAQAELVPVAYLVTDDSETMFKYCQQFREMKLVTFKPIKLEDGFELSFLAPDGQREIEDHLQSMKLRRRFAINE
jgi:predicted nucleic acid-binding protein